MLKTSCRKCGRRCGWGRGAITLVEWMPGHGYPVKNRREQMRYLTVGRDTCLLGGGIFDL